ncbi:MAG: amidohydrolase family protein [Acidobacteriaceae bacterium]|nr:amidohydrolase family protein [Acidobacteriaceae bacterium]MBV9781568.1 amidohydrolase family protein [Acidobacteriaceae bacterium]
MKHVYVLAVAALSAYAADLPTPIAIRDARVVTVSGAEIPKGAVLLRGGLIQDVGPNVSIPAGAWVIDGTGLTVYPGFIDALSTWGIPGAAEPAGGGRPAGAPGPAPVTPSPQTPPAQAQAPRSHGPEDRPQTYSFERAADLVSPTDRRLEAARAAGFTTAATFPNRGIFEGLGAMVNLAGERSRDMVIAEPIGQQIVFRTGGFFSGFPNSLMGNIAYVRQLYLDLDHYKQAHQIYDAHVSGTRRPEYDHDLEGLARSPRVLLPAMEAQQIDRILSFGPELKTPFIVYGLHEAYRRIDELKRANVPVLVSLKWPEKPKDQDPADVPNYRELEMWDRAPGVPGLLAKAQVKFGFYSDRVDTAPDLKKALKKAVDGGLSRADAIRALTLSVAEMYGLSDRLGSIDKGKIANLVVMKGDAFDDKTTVEYVFIDGVQFKPSKETQKGPEKKEGATTGPQKPERGIN